MKTFLEYIKKGLLFPALLATVIFANSCEDAVVMGVADESPYTTINDTYLSLKPEGTQRDLIHLTLSRETLYRNLQFHLTRPAAAQGTIRITPDEEAIEEFNRTNFTDYLPFPQSLVTIGSSGNISVAQGATSSGAIPISFQTGTQLVKGEKYLFAVTVDESSLGEYKLSTRASTVYFVIDYLGDFAGTEKDSGIVGILYIDNGTGNPLNAMTYVLEDSGKQFFDIVHIFACGFNYDSENKRVVVGMNKNIAHILEHRDKYIRPLQERGIKVCISLLGSRMGVGPANLPDDIIKDFIGQVKTIIDTYGLDGIDFDDEWVEYSKAPYPLPSSLATSFPGLIMEARRQMPDKLITVYYIGETSQLRGTHDFDGTPVQMGELIDYAYYPYYGSYSTNYSNITGLTPMQWGPAPQELTNLDGDTSPANARRVRSGGYGVNLCYDMTAGLDYTDFFNEFSESMYDEKVVRDGPIYQKEW
ncbi:MAG: DUF1735 domain-containing protein [Rikenellaceae bacterium]|nr:DUF1735 domain-containing protein [Rikenellaceae bacterium]